MKNIFFHENHYFAVRKFVSKQFNILIDLDDWWVDKNSKFGPQEDYLRATKGES